MQQLHPRTHSDDAFLSAVPRSSRSITSQVEMTMRSGAQNSGMYFHVVAASVVDASLRSRSAIVPKRPVWGRIV